MMRHGRRRSWLYAAAGVMLSTLAPAGLLVLREVASPRPMAEELFADTLTYAYVFLATAMLLAALGFVLGKQTDRLLMLSSTDPLTGLLNRRAFRRRLHEEIQRAIRYRSSLSLLLLDLDGLKQINDTQGHAAGDRAIQSVAAAITRTLRRSDYAARWGGDEFAVVAPNASFSAARATATRLAAQVRERGASGETPVAISIGIASFDPVRRTPGDVDDLVAAADEALYAAKERADGICAFDERDRSTRHLGRRLGRRAPQRPGRRPRPG
jgi:diguanylate cyclase (GGDEF)-like protein